MREFFNTSRTGATRVWRIVVSGDAIHTEFGQLDGKMQQITDYGSVKNEGRSNEISAKQDAQNLAERMILEKTRKGYTEDTPDQSESRLDPFAPGGLPEQLSFYKPKNSMSAKMTEMVKRGVAWVVRKYDGEMMVIVKNLQGKVEIYSRRMLKTHHLEPDRRWVDRFEHIAREIRTNTCIPPGTVLLGEMVADYYTDDRWHVAQVIKSKTDKANRLQQERPLSYVIWDVAWWEGRQLLSETELRFRLDHADLCAGKWVKSAECIAEYSGVSGLMETASMNGWEGFVVVDPYSTYGDRAYNLRGKPDRPAGCCKLKPVFEDDFLALWAPSEGIGSYGRGRNTGKLGSVELYQYDSDGEPVYICDMGNGWTKEFIQKNSTEDCWPKVVQVKYESRTYVSRGDKTNALQFPRFVSERLDKDMEECINPEL